MKQLIVSVILFFSCLHVVSQTPNEPERKFTTKKGFALYALLQPMWQNQDALNQRLATVNLPNIRSYNGQMGIGFSYLFKTGTELALDVSSSARTLSTPTYHMNISPISYDFVIRQSLIAIHREMQAYVLVGGAGFEQHISIERPTPVTQQFNQVLATNNVSRFSQSNDGILFGIGIRGISENERSKNVSEYFAIELGYRTQLGYMGWNTFYHMLENSPEADIRQFYLSIKLGAFLKAREKSRKKS